MFASLTFLQEVPFSDQIGEIIILLVVLAVAWFVLRFVFRMAMRVFTIGCGAILILGLILAILRFMN